MDVFKAIDAFTAIDSMCRIILKNASASAKSQVVAKVSGRTLGEIVEEIAAVSREAANAISDEYNGKCKGAGW